MFCCRNNNSSGNTNRESRLFLPILGLLIVLYLLIGGLIFTSIEGPQEISDLRSLNNSLGNLARNNNITKDRLIDILLEYDRLTLNGNTASDIFSSHAHVRKWSFNGAFVFCATAVTTMGFGIATPHNQAARMIFILYSLIGCPAAFLFFNTWLHRFIEYFTMIGNFMKRHKVKQKINRERKKRKAYVAPPLHVLIALSLLTVLFLTITSLIYTFTEQGWNFVTSLYYCFTTFSTIGFGDLVSGQNHHYDTINRYIYHFIDGILIVMGTATVYSLFNMLSLYVKKLINAITSVIEKCQNGNAKEELEPDMSEDENGKGSSYRRGRESVGAVRLKKVRKPPASSMERWRRSFFKQEAGSPRRKLSTATLEVADTMDVVEEKEGHRYRPSPHKSIRGKTDSRRTRTPRHSKIPPNEHDMQNGGKFHRFPSFHSAENGSPIDGFMETELSAFSFKIRDKRRRNSDPVCYSPTFDLLGSFSDRLSQSIRTDPRSPSSPECDEAPEWDDSRVVFPLSIMQNNMDV